MRATLRIQALICNPQPFHRPPAHQVLRHNLFRILRLHMPVPNRFGIHNHGGSVLALVQAAGFIDSHPAAQPGLFRELLQPRMQLAFSIGRARGPRRVRGAGIVADKDVMFERRQAQVSSTRIQSV